MLLETEETENMDGTRTVNGPDVEHQAILIGPPNLME